MKLTPGDFIFGGVNKYNKKYLSKTILVAEFWQLQNKHFRSRRQCQKTMNALK